MRILMISTDRTAFEEGSPTRRRMETYAKAVGNLDIVIFSLRKNGLKRVDAGPLSMYPTNSFFRLLYGWNALRAPYVRERIDAITVQDPFEVGLVGLILSRRLKVPLQMQVHTDLFSPAFKQHSFLNRIRLVIAKIVLRRADRIRVVSERIRRGVELHVREETRKQISVLPIFVDIDHFKKAEAPRELAERFSSFKKKVLVVSRLEAEKNVALAIRSFADGAPKDACLIILGDGRQRAALGELAAGLGVRERVFFEGRSDPAPYYALASLALVPSLYEGYGMTIIEALAARVPVIAGDVGIAPEAGASIFTDSSKWPGAIRESLAKPDKQGVLISYPYTGWDAYVSAWRNDIAACLPITRRLAAYAAKKPRIGFIGQGFIGKSYADEFERRGFTHTTRYALEEPYRQNRDKIRECDITFIAVPTPTTPEGFDASIVENSLALIGKGKIAVVKSTILPGTTARFQEKYPDIIVLYSPEFLSVATAAYDAAHPFSNIVGMTRDTPEQMIAAEAVLSILPESGFAQVCMSTEAEIIKYTHNSSAYTQIILFNLMYDLAAKLGMGWDNIRDAVEADPFISRRYARPVHKSGRGAGGFCFIKDVAALRREYEKVLADDKKGSAFFRAMEAKNIELLENSQKDLDLLAGVYGEDHSQL